MILDSPLSPLVERPFRYRLIPRALDASFADALLTWLETDAPWTLKIAEFYEQYELSFTDVDLPTELRSPFEADNLGALRERVESLFDTRLDRRIDVTAHRLTSGQRIRIHNDFIPGQETHRLLIQLNRGWPDSNGGVLALFNSSDPKDVHRILRPIHNTGFLFEISSRSLHAVTPILTGQRFTLVASFYGRDS